ncbi:MAG: phosphopantetheine adenylyltransferase [Chitinophagales bacterium]|nr:MAG: phosphopantetheine adenylyltransferase [Chitinophagales bacterium]
MSAKIALFPGSFDPITKGHVNVLLRALPLFDKVIVALGNNTSKRYAFPFEKRHQWIKEIFRSYPTVEVMAYQGLTVDFARKVNARYLIRGIRNSSDFEYEKTIAQLNKSMMPELETICILSDPEHGHISSTIVREIILNGGDPGIFLPPEVQL